MELKKVGYCYASYNELKKVLNNYKKEYGLKHFYKLIEFQVKTNKGINFSVTKSFKEFKYPNRETQYYWNIFGYNAGALAKFEQHTNITALSIREYNDIKGGAPYQVFKGGQKNAVS